jgi:hypothetical protein
MKKFLLSLLVIIVALGLLGAAGFAGYRYGFIQGMIVASNQSTTGNGIGNGNGKVQPWGPGFGMMQRGMPMHNFGDGRGFERDGFGRMRRGGFGFFPLLGALIWLLFLGLIVAGIVWLINRSGWRLTRTASVAAAPVTPAPVVETHPSTTDEENPQP